MATISLTPAGREHYDHTDIIGRAYVSYHKMILGYLRSRINNSTDAEDLSHDVFIRLLEYKQILIEGTVKQLVFFVARNLLYDYLRRTYKNRRIAVESIDEMMPHAESLEGEIIADDIRRFEINEVERLSPKRKEVYILCRFCDFSADDIVERMNLSKRTVENHILAARKTIRTAMLAHCV